MTEKEIEILTTAKRVIREEFSNAGIRVKSLILFGSRARNAAQEDSDWDFLVVVDTPPVRSTQIAAILAIQRFFGKMLIPIDIMVKSAARIEKEKEDPGFMTQTILSEGLQLSCQ